MVLNTHAPLRYNTQFSRLPKFDTGDTQSLFRCFYPIFSVSLLFLFHFISQRMLVDHYAVASYPFTQNTSGGWPLSTVSCSLWWIIAWATHTLFLPLSPPTHGSHGPLQTLQGMIRPGWSWCTTQSPCGQPTPDWVSPLHVFLYSRTWTLPALHEPMPSMSRWQNWGAKLPFPLTWCCHAHT